MKFVTPLYVGEKAVHSKGAIIRGLKQGHAPFNSYVLMLPLNKGDQLDIIAAGMLKLPYFENRDIKIVGVANGKDDAINLAAAIAAEAVEQTGSARILDYLKERQRKNMQS